ncbi:MAG: tetratricopeptide repeat protein, partial [Spirochaetota bacterium]
YPEFISAEGNLYSFLLTWIQYVTDKQRDYEKAIRFNKKAIETFPENEKLKENLIYVYSRYGEYLSIKNRYNEAVSRLEEGKEYLPEYSGEFDKIIKSVYLNHAGQLSNKATFEKAFKVIDEALSKYPDDTQLTKMKINLFADYGIYLSTKGSHISIDIINKGLDEFSDNDKLKNTKVNIYKNLWSQMMKKNDFEKAQTLLEEAKDYSNLRDSEYEKMLKQIYVKKISELVKNDKFNEAVKTLNEAFALFERKASLVQSAKYTMQEYNNSLINRNLEYEKVLNIYKDLLNQSKENKDFTNIIYSYLTDYIQHSIQELLRKDNKEKTLEYIGTANSVFTDLTFDEIFNNTYIKILDRIVDKGNYNEAIQFFFNTEAVNEDENMKNYLYNLIYKNIRQNKEISTTEAFNTFKSIYNNYDKGNATLEGMILAFYTEEIKREIHNIYIKKIPIDEQEREKAMEELNALINESIEFFEKNNIDDKLQKFYISISVTYYRANNTPQALKYSKEGYLKYKDNEILKNNTIGFYIERAKELVELNKDKEYPYREAIELLQEAIKLFEEEDRGKLNQLLSKYLEESRS